MPLPVVLIVAAGPLADELHHTLLGRTGVELRSATTRKAALALAVAVRPALALVDRDLPRARHLVKELRETCRLSIAVVARGDFDPEEQELLEAGANAVLRLPADADWDERLARLIAVAPRQSVRAPVSVDFEATPAGAMERVWGHLVNVSVTGMLMECAAPLDVGAEVDFSFRLPPAGAPLVGRGRVVRRAAPDRFGVEFRGLDADAADRLRRFVASAEGPRAAG
jgi:CheY-like chemotaxis protein